MRSAEELMRSPFAKRVFVQLAAAVLVWVAPGRALADDGKAKSAVDDALAQITAKKYDNALSGLDKAHQMCRRSKCSPAIEADMFLAMGIAYGLKDEADKGRTRFEWALARKPDAEPDGRFMTRKLKTMFTDAQAKVKDKKGAQPPGQVGAMSATQKECVDTAKQVLASGDWEICLGTMVQCLGSGDFAAGKLMSARCQDKGNLLLEAKRDAQAAVDLAKSDGDTALAKEASDYLQEVDLALPKILLLYHPEGAPKKKLCEQSAVKELVVNVDGQPVDSDKLCDPIPHNPGRAIVQVKGKRSGQPYEVQRTIQFERAEQIEQNMFEEKTPIQICYEKARNFAERQKCDEKYGEKPKGLNVKAGLEVSSYNDTDHVDVVSPSLFFAAVQPTQGWNVGGQVLVDVVTTASADIIATASRRFDQVRFGATLGGGYKIGPATVGITGSTSIENDYIARSVGANVSADVASKMATPYLAYDYGFDILGRADTKFAVFRRDLQRHTINFGSSIVFNPSTIGVFGGTVQIELGDSSKPYRHVAMFNPEDAAAIPKGASADLVAMARLPLMPFEQLPDSRFRYAALLGAMHRFETSTLRGTERLYIDNWGLMASTTDVRFLWDVYEAKGEGGKTGYPQLRLTPHVRFHIQGPVKFWQRTYVARQDVGGYELPAFRTGDRELGPLWALTGGAGVRAAPTKVLALGVQVEGIYTRFLDHLYIFDRWGLFTASTLELEFD
jgi:hypothetical protein